MQPVYKNVGESIETQRKDFKIQANRYLPTGEIPIVDQGADFIAGYIDDHEKIYTGPLPVIVFGDHTCCLKYISFRFAVGADGTQLIRPTSAFDVRFFYYALRAQKMEHFGYQRHFKFLKTKTVPWFPLTTQRKIASILSAYDDLIENNTRRIKILEAMAQMIYREWFIKFRFPGHEKVKMLDVPVETLHATSLQKVPEGWEVKPVTGAVEINPRTTVPKEGEKPFVPMGSLSNNAMLITNIESRTGNSGSKFKNGDTLFARITPCLENGKTGYVQFLPSEKDVAFGSTEFIVLRSKTLCPEYVYLMSRSEEFRDNAIKSMSGATGRQRVSDKCFAQFFIAQPDSKTLARFTDHVSPMFKAIHNLASRNDNLRQTRDLLLPRLISGTVDVEDLDININVET